VLIVPSTKGSELVVHELVTTGDVVIQDRSSCLSVISADIHPGDTILDACAAPGSKSLHALQAMAV